MAQIALSQAGAVLAGCDIGCGKAFTVHRKTYAIVFDRYAQMFRLAYEPHRNLPGISASCLSRPGLNGFHRVLEHIRHGLPKLVPVAAHLAAVDVACIDAELDPVMRDFLKEHRLANEIDRVLGSENRLGKAREGRKLIDHLTQIAHLPDDCARQLIK